MIGEDDAGGERDRLALSVAEGGGKDARRGETEFSGFDEASERDAVVGDGVRREGRLHDVSGDGAPGWGSGAWARQHV